MRVQLGWVEGYCPLVGAVAQFYTAIPLNVGLRDPRQGCIGRRGIGAGQPVAARKRCISPWCSCLVNY